MKNIDRGLILSVLRNAEGNDYTLDGITARATKLVLVGVLDSTKSTARTVEPLDERSRVFPAAPDRPAVAIEVRRRAFNDKHHVALVPVNWDADANTFVRPTQWSMYGGNFATAGDSRFAELVEQLLGYWIPVLAVHDRIERTG
ncbi:hypothetical protein ABIE52_006806 [Rhodococcus sp. OAS809]|uniref:hypothetical protein n=1 Tax=Rhodococcus sp. OAS809 TaxID=2663874 RepID=UPI00178B2176